jgi:hypothetical protein
MHQASFARQLGCTYQGGINWNNWPVHKECLLTSVDLSEAHKSETHSFTGSSSEKTEVSLVRFDQSNLVDFVPPEVIREFPNLNALAITYSNVPVVKTGFFGREFKNLQFLSFYYSKVEAIEAGAFTELENLKHIWIYASPSPIKTLQFGLFRNNLKLEFTFFGANKISMIHPALFDDLTHLKLLYLDSNVCVSKTIGCATCTVSQSELKSDLATCFANCRADPECSASVKTTTPKIEIPSSTESTTIKPINLDLTCEAILKNQSIEIGKIFQKTAQVETKLQKNLASSENISGNLEACISKGSNFMGELKSLKGNNYETQNSLIENATKVLTDSIDSALKNMKTTNDDLKAVIENSNKESREYLDSKVDTLKETILKTTNDRVDKVVELVETKLELEKAKHALEKKDWEEKNKNLEEKVKKLEEKLSTQCQEIEENFKQQMADYVKKQFEEFENKFVA